MGVKTIDYNKVYSKTLFFPVCLLCLFCAKSTSIATKRKVQIWHMQEDEHMRHT